MLKREDIPARGELVQLIYTSVAMRPMQPADLEAILSTSLEFNSRHGITGLLVYFSTAGEFIQLLEGAREAVLSLYNDRIKQDPRHRNVQTFYLDRAESRICPDWSMSFRVEEDGALRKRLPVSDFVDGGALTGEETAMAHRLMIAYRDQMVRELAV